MRLSRKTWKYLIPSLIPITCQIWSPKTKVLVVVVVVVVVVVAVVVVVVVVAAAAVVISNLKCKSSGSVSIVNAIKGSQAFNIPWWLVISCTPWFFGSKAANENNANNNDNNHHPQLTSRNPQPTTNQQPAAKSQQATPSRTFPATTNIRAPTTNYQLLTSDHKQLMITTLFIMSIYCGSSGFLRFIQNLR